MEPREQRRNKEVFAYATRTNKKNNFKGMVIMMNNITCTNIIVTEEPIKVNEL